MDKILNFVCYFSSSDVLTLDAPSLGSMYAINAILVETPQIFQQLGLTEEVIDILTKSSQVFMHIER